MKRVNKMNIENINFENIEEYFDSLDDEYFKDISNVRAIKNKLNQLDYDSSTVSLTNTDKHLIDSVIYKGSLSISTEKSKIFKNLIVTGNLWIQGTELIIKKNLIVGGDVYLSLNNITNLVTSDDKINCLGKTRFFVGHSLVSIGKVKTNFNCNHGENSLTVFEEVNISGNCYFNNGSCNFYDDVNIGGELVANSLQLYNCNELNLNGNANLNRLKIVGKDTSIDIQKKIFIES